MQELGSHIRELLREHNCVIIPGFGGFVGHYESAVHSEADHRFRPPHKRISFNRFLDRNDGLLAKRISSETGIGYDEANEQLEQSVRQLREQLSRSEVIEWPSVGKLYADQQENIQFNPGGSEQLLADAYGLPELTLSPIAREAELIEENFSEEAVIAAPATIEPTYTEEAPPLVKKKRGRMMYAAVLVIAVLMLALSTPWLLKWTGNGTGGMIPQSDQAGILIDSPTGIFRKDKKEQSGQAGTAGGNEQSDATAELVEAAANIASEVLRVSDERNLSGFYVVKGSFQQISLAVKLKNELEIQGRQAYIFKSEHGYNRVGYYASREYADADRMLETERGADGKAWLIAVNI